MDLQDRYDFIVAGAGLAGASAAYYLSGHGRVLVLEANRPASGASGISAGLVSPISGQKAKKAWRLDEALPELHRMLAVIGASRLFFPVPIWHQASSDEQAALFRKTAANDPRYAEWIDRHEAERICPDIQAPHGVISILGGGFIPVPALIEALLAAAGAQGAQILTGFEVTGWGDLPEGAFVNGTKNGKGVQFEAGRVILSLGAWFTRFEELAQLRLHRVKGQVVRVARPMLQSPSTLPLLAGHGFIAPHGDELYVGATYEHDFADERPSAEVSQQLLARATKMLPALSEARILEEKTGVRTTVPGIRLPMIGPLWERNNVFIFSGLGSKGLLMAPFLASRLYDFVTDPAQIPSEIRVRRA